VIYCYVLQADVHAV